MEPIEAFFHSASCSAVTRERPNSRAFLSASFFTIPRRKIGARWRLSSADSLHLRVDRAQTTTIAALRTAVIVSQALSRQKLVLDQINALNTVTSNLIESTSEQLRIQGGAINQQAASATIDIAKLQASFDNVFATMDALDTFRGQAVDSMAQTVTALQGQIERAKPYLERTRQGETPS